MSDPLNRLLAEPGAARADRIRRRCRARLVRQASPASGRRGPVFRGEAWQPLIALLGIVYLTEVILQAISAHGPP